MYAMASGRINSLANIKPNIHPRLQHGEKFLKWTDQDQNAIGVTLQIDSNGFFLYWHDQKNEITILDMAQIRDIRTGSEAKTPKDSKTREVVSMGPGILEEKTITVVHGVDLTNIFFLNFCTNKINVAEFWCQEMSQLIRNFNPLLSNAMQSLRKIHTKILLKSNADGSIPVKLVSNFFAQNKEDHKIIEQALDMSGLPSDKNESFPKLNFGFENFLVFYSHIVKLPEIKSFFEKLCGEGKKYLNMEEFLGFLNKTQRDSRLNEVLFPYATEQIALEIITKYEPNQHLVKKQQLSFDGLVRFLLSEDNLAVSPVLREDMDRPLAHYFINSSHNTYLTGHQLTGKSSAEMYRQVLLAGCRCVELDFWNGRSDEEPKICHGYTLVPEIQAREVFQAIAESAFKTSKYPLILSFENHCNPKQQAKIAEYCKHYFGSALLNEPIASHPLEKNVMLPSPRDLKGKILIKNKKKHVHNHQMKSSYSTPDSIPTVFYDTCPGAPNSSPCHDSDDTDTSDSEIEEDKLKKSCDVSPHTDSGTAEKESKAGAEISALVNYIQPVHFKGFNHAKNRMRYNEMSSMVETCAYTQLKESPLDFVDYNKFQLSRIYPKGTRMDSSNYMPQAFWNTGCQLVALNFQTLDVPMQLNLGIFQFNGSTGYKLKPDFMCRDEPGHRKFDPFTESSVDGVVSATVSIKVLSGQFLTDRHVGTYVEVEMYGLPSDTVCRHKRFRTKIVPNNGICPIYFDSGSSPFVFHQVILPHLAVIRIAAYEESGKLIGLRVLPVLNLNPGFKNLPLFNESGQPLYCPCLFLLIEVADFVPNSWSELAEALSNPIAYQSELEKREYQLSVLRDDFYNQNQENSNPSVESRPSDEINSPSKSPLVVVRNTSAGAGPYNKDTKDKTISQSADNNKTLPTNVKETISPLESITLNQDSIETIFKHKSVKEKESELICRIDSLAKKFQKEIVKLDSSKTNTEYMLSQASNHTKNPLHKASLKIVKKISASNFENITIHQVSHNIQDRRVALQKSYEEKRVQLWKTHAINEKEIKDRYFQLIWQCAEKQIKKSHTSQLKILHNLYSQEVDQIMKRIEKESKNHQAENNTVDQISHGDITRDRRNRLIKRGVAERGHLQEIYNEKKYELEQEQLIVRKEFNERWEVAQKQLDNEYKDKMILIDSMIGSTTSGETA